MRSARSRRIPLPAGLVLLAAACGGGGGGSSPGPQPPGPTAPAAPSGLAAVATSSTAVSLTWQDNSSDETGFVLERKAGAGGTFAAVASLPADSTSRTDSALSPSTTYFYRLRAQNAAGFSAYSPEASATTLAGGGGSATVWAKSYAGPGDTRANALQPTADGGFVVAGSLRSGTAPTASQAAWAMKIAADGSVTWQKTYGGSQALDAFEAVRQTADLGYVLAGGFRATSSDDVWVVRLDANGAILWQKRYGTPGPNQRAYDVYQTDDDGDGLRDDGFIVAGYANFPAERAWVLKVAADGTLEWEHLYDTASQNSAATAVRQAPDRSYLVTGYRFDPLASPSRSDFFVLRLQPNGAPSSLTTYPLADRSFAQGAELTSDGGLIVAGYTDVDASASINDEAWLLKLAAGGSVDWQLSYGDGPGGSFSEHALDVREKPGGGYLVAGRVTGYGASSNDFWLLEVDAAGAVTSQRRYGGLGGDTANAVAVRPNGGCILAGTTTGFLGTDHGMAWIVSLDSTRAMTFDPPTNVTTATTGAQAAVTAAVPTSVTLGTPDGLGILGVDTAVAAVDSAVTVTTQSR